MKLPPIEGTNNINGINQKILVGLGTSDYLKSNSSIYSIANKSK